MEEVKKKDVKDDVPPDDLRCNRTDGRDWRCKRPALPGKSLCEPHLHRCSSSSKKPGRVVNNGGNSGLGLDDGTVHKPIRIRFRVKPEFVIDDPVRYAVGAQLESGMNARDGEVFGGVAVAHEVVEGPSEIVGGETVTSDSVAEVSGEAVPRESVEGLHDKGDERVQAAQEVVEGVQAVQGVVGVLLDKGDERVQVAQEVVEGVQAVQGVAEGLLDKRDKRVQVAHEVSEGVPAVQGIVKGLTDTTRDVVKVVERERNKEAAPDHVRCHRNDGRTWRCKREVVEGQTLCEVHFSKWKNKSGTKGLTRPMVRGPRVKRPAVSDVEERGDNAGEGAITATSSTVLLQGPQREGEDRRCRRDSGKGWRCEKQAIEGHTMCMDHVSGGKRKLVEVSDGEKVRKSKGKGKKGNVNVDGDVVVEKVPSALRCTRNDGKDWRCKRRVVEGQTLCEAHLKGVKLKDVETVEERKPVKKKRKKKVEREGGGMLMEVKKEVEEDDGNQLAMVADVAVAEAEAERREGGRSEEDELRCKRTDGRGWRCKRRVAEGKTLCEIHYEQGKLRQKRITVPDSMKIQKADVGGEKVEKKLKKKRALEVLENSSNKGMKRMKAELIRVFLRREIIEQNKKSDKGKGSVSNISNGEVTRDLPYGLMAIPPAPPAQILSKDGSLGIKVGVHSSNSLVKRRFRSKNIEPPPTGAVKAVPFAGNVGKVKNSGKRKCHWCRNSDASVLIKCLNCKKRFFCSNCIKQRDNDPEEVKLKCPVCCGSCDCRACLSSRSKDVNTKAIIKGTPGGSKFQQLQYLITLLLPVLEQINEEQNIEAEMEAKLKGQELSEVAIRHADVGCRDQCCCNNCKSLILDFHRSCPNCSFNLCLSCCQEYSQGGYLRGSDFSCSKDRNTIRAHLPGMRLCSEKIRKSTSGHSSGSGGLVGADSLSDSAPCYQITCPPMELGGCDNSLLDLRCIFPLNWTKELEISAKETVSVFGSLPTIDDSPHCSLCSSVAQAATKGKELEEVSRRESDDNLLYCPSSSDDRHAMLSHFQKHWQKGHPVKVREVLHPASTFSWDPLAMFCSYLENDANDSVNMKDPVEALNCSGWFEVELGTRESFAHSLEEGYARRRHETLRVKAKLSPTFSQKVLDGRYTEIIQALPLQEYTNPRSGLLNIAGKLPEDFPVLELGPHVYISFGSREVLARGELVTKLHYNSYDVVNILVHVGDAPCPLAQLNKIKKLIRGSNSKEKADESSPNLENEEARIQSEISVEAAGQEKVMEGTTLNLRIGDATAAVLPNDKSSAKVQNSDTESDASMICSGANDSPCKSDQVSNIEHVQGSILIDQRSAADSCGAQWDVFRRKDVPKLLEYIVKHVYELSFCNDFPKSVIHPLFDGSFYLDATHKLQLKEEFGIEPWTFKQSVGEAVLIPAGCPYQIKNLKTCVNVAVGFISPENATECIKLINEIRLLPNNHKAKQVKLEVEKMTICSVDEAIKEIYRLKSEEASRSDEGVFMPIVNG